MNKNLPAVKAFHQMIYPEAIIHLAEGEITGKLTERSLCGQEATVYKLGLVEEMQYKVIEGTP